MGILASYMQSSASRSVSDMMMVPSIASLRSYSVERTLKMTFCIRSISWRRNMFIGCKCPNITTKCVYYFPLKNAGTVVSRNPLARFERLNFEALFQGDHQRFTIFVLFKNGLHCAKMQSYCDYNARNQRCSRKCAMMCKQSFKATLHLHYSSKTILKIGIRKTFEQLHWRENSGRF